jgi:hypothetical protein
MRSLARLARLGSGIFLLAWPLFANAASDPLPDALTADGGRYFGPLVGGKLHGRGRLEWDNGARYEGGFENGLYSGAGRMDFGTGQIYEGKYRSGMMAGRGRMQSWDGTVYVGEFRNDAFNGQGRYEMHHGEVYEGAFENWLFHGQGRLIARTSKYQGEFRKGTYWGQGELEYDNGRKYRGEFVLGDFQGKGRLEEPDGAVYEGNFDKNEFIGGTYTRKDGTRYEGGFRKWRFHGAGRYVNAGAGVYEGQFSDGQLSGVGRFASKDGTYEGEFKQWRFDGQGVLRLSNGDTYKGGFARGLYEGEGTLRYAKPRPNGRTQDSGVWRYGMLDDKAEREKAAAEVELALYSQRALLDKALASLAYPDPRKPSLYLLAVAGDGSQEVFRREVEFVRAQFDREFGTKGRSLALINSRSTMASVPMATVTSIREALRGIAARMNKENDILFLFLTSHGSKDHELVLNQNNMTLRNLSARQLGELLKETGIRWKVVVVSACYGGGFIDSVKDESTLVITAARHDRQSFGCADENDFTYFGRAFFREALPRSSSFQEAFQKAEALVQEWEMKDLKTEDKARKDGHSLPQIMNPPAVNDYLRYWWAQRAAKKPNR